MFRKLITASLVSVLLAGFTSVVAAADQPGAAEAKLRETLRATTLQLRNVEAERATLQAAQAEMEAKSKMLTEQLEKLTKDAAANQAEADRALNELKGKMDERDREIGALRVSLDKWKTDHQKITDFARAKEAQRAKLADRAISLDHQVADQQRRNQAMYKLGTEILARYEKFGLGAALTAREPFIGLTRVKFENLIQDYGDKLSDERIKSQPSAAAQASQPAQPPKKSQTSQPTAAKPKTVP